MKLSLALFAIFTLTSAVVYADDKWTCFNQHYRRALLKFEQRGKCHQTLTKVDWFGIFPGSGGAFHNFSERDYHLDFSQYSLESKSGLQDQNLKGPLSNGDFSDHNFVVKSCSATNLSVRFVSLVWDKPQYGTFTTQVRVKRDAHNGEVNELKTKMYWYHADVHYYADEICR